MTEQKNRLLSLVGLVSGFLGALLGLGGGFIVGPLLITLNGLTAKQAISTSLAIVFLTSLVSFFSRFLLDPSLFFVEQTSYVIVGAVIGTVIGSVLVKRFSGDWILALFAALLASIAFWVLVPGIFLAAQNPVEWISWNALTIGLVGGILSGFFGVGGGFWFVPATHYFLGYSFPQAVVNSLAAVLFSTAFGTALYEKSVHTKLDIVWKITPFDILGSVIGAVSSPWIPVDLAKGLFAALVGIESILLIRKVLQHHHGKRFYAWVLHEVQEFEKGNRTN